MVVANWAPTGKLNEARLVDEQLHHESQAEIRKKYFQDNPEKLIFRDDDYLNHAPWIRPAIHFLAPGLGQSILDIGCGHGMASIVMARKLAKVSAIDLSPGYIAEATLRAKANQVEIQFFCGNGEELPFADQSFDGIWGNAILHHLELEPAFREIDRILKPGGKAVFCEPWGGNPLVQAIRRWFPYPGKDRSRFETPFQKRHLRLFSRYFSARYRCRIYSYQFLGMVPLIFGREKSGYSWLNRIDYFLLNYLPGLNSLCRYKVIQIEKINNPK